MANRAKAMAAAGSDARMSGCERPVVINSGSGNQGMTASLPVIVKPVTEKRLPENLQTALCRDAFADDLFALALPNPEQRIGGGHFRKTPFCLR